MQNTPFLLDMLFLILGSVDWFNKIKYYVKHQVGLFILKLVMTILKCLYFALKLKYKIKPIDETKNNILTLKFVNKSIY